ncbi:MAG: hypothetical protein ACE15F_00135 [bacterium]
MILDGLLYGVGAHRSIHDDSVSDGHAHGRNAGQGRVGVTGKPPWFGP